TALPADGGRAVLLGQELARDVPTSLQWPRRGCRSGARRGDSDSRRDARPGLRAPTGVIRRPRGSPADVDQRTGRVSRSLCKGTLIAWYAISHRAGALGRKLR